MLFSILQKGLHSNMENHNQGMRWFRSHHKTSYLVMSVKIQHAYVLIFKFHLIQLFGNTKTVHVKVFSNFSSGHHFYHQSKKPRMSHRQEEMKTIVAQFICQICGAKCFTSLLHVFWYFANAATISLGP